MSMKKLMDSKTIETELLKVRGGFDHLAKYYDSN